MTTWLTLPRLAAVGLAAGLALLGGCVPQEPEDDEHEENDSEEEATEVSLDEEVTGVAVEDDPDVFAVSLAAAGAVEVDFTLPDAGTFTRFAFTAEGEDDPRYEVSRGGNLSCGSFLDDAPEGVTHTCEPGDRDNDVPEVQTLTFEDVPAGAFFILIECVGAADNQFPFSKDYTLTATMP